MARVRMVTRTVTEYNYSVMVVDTTTAEVKNELYVLTDELNDEKALKALRKNYETDTVKIVTIVDKYPTETLYGMPELDFIRLAKVLPPRGAKNEDIFEDDNDNDNA